eukprot:7668559-Pyramimonas_sp.AAC.1
MHIHLHAHHTACGGKARSVGLDTDIYGARKELVGELNYRVTRWFNKVLMVNSTVSVSSPSA